MKNFNNFLAIIFVVALLATVYFVKQEKWEGFYYPNGCLSCEEDYIYSPPFKSLENCLAWADNLQALSGNPTDDFECGKNCKNKNGLKICEVTTDSPIK